VRRGLGTEMKSTGCFDPRSVIHVLTFRVIPSRSHLGRQGKRSRIDLALPPKVFGAPRPAQRVSAPFFTTRRGVVETETLRLGVMSALFFLAGRKAADIGALLSKCPFSLFLWLAVWRPSLVSLEAHAELPG